MIVRRAVAGDEPVLRALRLQALSESPDAFGSTYDRELARTAADWQRWLSPGATFIADDMDGPKGLVAAQRDAADPSLVHLMAMWVHPQKRASGTSDALVAAVMAWAGEVRAHVVRLIVIESNDRARRCYQRGGFRLTGRRTVRERDGAIEVEMEHQLGELRGLSNSAPPGD